MIVRVGLVSYAVVVDYVDFPPPATAAAHVAVVAVTDGSDVDSSYY